MAGIVSNTVWSVANGPRTSVGCVPAGGDLFGIPGTAFRNLPKTLLCGNGHTKTKCRGFRPGIIVLGGMKPVPVVAGENISDAAGNRIGRDTPISDWVSLLRGKAPSETSH